MRRIKIDILEKLANDLSVCSSDSCGKCSRNKEPGCFGRLQVDAAVAIRDVIEVLSEGQKKEAKEVPSDLKTTDVKLVCGINSTGVLTALFEFLGDGSSPWETIDEPTQTAYQAFYEHGAIEFAQQLVRKFAEKDND